MNFAALNIAARILLGALLALAVYFIVRWYLIERGRAAGKMTPGWLQTATGFVTNFFDTLGIGSFATTTAIFKFFKVTADEKIPGTLNVGHAIPTFAQAIIFIAAVNVDPTTLIAMIAASVLGAWLGAGVVSKLPRRAIQVGMGIALIAAAALFYLQVTKRIPGGGEALALNGALLAAGLVGNFILGALMTLGIGLYGPCLILVSMLGMNPLAAFPIMMGSCAFLMPVAGLRFIRSLRYDCRAAIGLALGGVPAVLIAAYWVKSLPLDRLRQLVIVVVLYAAATMLWSAWRKESVQAQSPQSAH